jgi:hypothetical protein
MPSAFRDPAKDLADWIELDYHQRRRHMRRWLRRLTLGTVLLGGLAVAAFAGTKRAPRTYQAGAVSAPHAFIGNDCGQCHTAAWRVTARFWPPNASLATVADSACKKCHTGAPHNPSFVRPSEVPHCSGCHHEHHGRDALAQVPDGECTACHADLKRHATREGDCPYGNVTSFPADHPAFILTPAKGHPVALDGAESRDPGRLFFNHAVHRQSPKVLKKDPHTGLERGLDCADCHRPDVAGQYMLPIGYDAHCKECHAIRVQLAGVFHGDKAEKAEREFAKDPLPHPAPGQGPEVVRAALRDRLFRLAQQYPNLVGAPEADARGVPGPPRGRDAGEREWRWVDEKAGEAERMVFWNAQAPRAEDQVFRSAGGCGYCHVQKRRQASPARPDSLPAYEATALPQRWFLHSHFSHQKHEGIAKCQLCHARADQSTDTAEIMMPAKEVCARCHAPGADGGGGARHDCVECHLYHPRDLANAQPRRRPDAPAPR